MISGRMDAQTGRQEGGGSELWSLPEFWLVNYWCNEVRSGLIMVTTMRRVMVMVMEMVMVMVMVVGSVGRLVC